MDTTKFWALVEAARAAASDPTDAGQVAEQAATLLARQPVPEILSCAQVFWDLMARSYRTDLWGAAYEINGGCSDDGFDYFRGWLIMQGQATFEAVIADPDVLATLPVIQAAAASGEDLECEEALSIPYTAYLSATGAELPADAYAIGYPDLKHDWDFEDDREARRRLPRLMQLYDPQ